MAKIKVASKESTYCHIFTDKKTILISNLNICIKLIQKKMKKYLRISKNLIE